MRIVIASAALVMTSLSFAEAQTIKPLTAPKLAPQEVQSTFFNGKEFTASTPSGVKFKMVFMPDGKASREPIGRDGAKGEGSWKLDRNGFCTTWRGSAATCYGVLNSGENRWSIVKGTTTVAVWSK